MKKILFCTPARLNKSLGHAKVTVELAEEMRLLDWECEFLCPWDFPLPAVDMPENKFAENLKGYLQKYAQRYDVIDYDHTYLPHARSEFSPVPLFVARSVLLAQHLETIAIPKDSRLKARIGHLIKGKERREMQQETIARAQIAVTAADLVNVSNYDDKIELIRRGIPPMKIVVLPYGISRTRRFLFDKIPSGVPSQPTVAFVGTFDYRKGAREFPKIVQEITQKIPGVRFKLLGVKGMFQTEIGIRACFPKQIQENLELVLTYQPDELPQMLSSCSVGIFPSYIEGMPFGVLEMLAASIPVIAYNSPGPPMMLPQDYLVGRGDWKSISKKVIALLQNESDLAEARSWAKSKSQEFNWKNIAETTSETYLRFLANR